jgi:hypothetical protein
MAEAIVTQPLPWMFVSVAVWTIAIAFILFALVVLAPPLLRELQVWSRENLQGWQSWHL